MGPLGGSALRKFWSAFFVVEGFLVGNKIFLIFWVWVFLVLIKFEFRDSRFTFLSKAFSQSNLKEQ